MIAAHDGAIAAMMAGRAAAAPVTVRHRDLAGGGRVYEITPAGLDDGDERVYLDIHGGGFIYGGGELCATMAVGTAIRMAARVWAVDYRMPPDHPFPAALDDCLAAYRALLAERPPDRIVIGGASAGGNLAAALILRARDEGLPLPAAVVLMTPAADLTEAGDSHQTNLGLDPLIPGSGKQSFLLYAAGHDLRHPYLSPLNGDFSQGLPARHPHHRHPRHAAVRHRAPAPGPAPGRHPGRTARDRGGRPRRVPGPGAGRPGDPGRGPALRGDPLGPLTGPSQSQPPLISNGPWLPPRPAPARPHPAGGQ